MERKREVKLLFSSYAHYADYSGNFFKKLQIHSDNIILLIH